MYSELQARNTADPFLKFSLFNIITVCDIKAECLQNLINNKYNWIAKNRIKFKIFSFKYCISGVLIDWLNLGHLLMFFNMTFYGTHAKLKKCAEGKFLKIQPFKIK